MPDRISTDVLIAGGGPAGMMLGLLLAKQGLRALVCERHGDFDREFRGEVLMPRFSQMLVQLGLLSFIESKLHLKLKDIQIFYRGKLFGQFSFSRIAPEMPYATWMPQPVMLSAFFEKASEFASFEMWFNASVTDLLKDEGRVIGAVVEKEGKKVEVCSKIVVGADGRVSAVKRAGGFETAYAEHDFDIIWFNAKKPENYPDTVRGFLSRKHNYLILPKYPDLLQCGILIPPGEYSNYVRSGVDSIRKELFDAHPALRDFASGLKDFSPFRVLQARVHLVKKWARDGCLLIGDAAHTCSPAGAVGVSVAVHTAIVAADVILKAFQEKDFSESFLKQVQSRREEDVREIQRIQKLVSGFVFPQNRLMTWLAPAVIQWITRTPAVRKLQRRLFVMENRLEIEKGLEFN